MDIANQIRERSVMRDLELLAALEKAKQPAPSRPHGDFLAQKMILAEMRANAKDELQLLQSLGVVYKASVRISTDMQVMTRLDALPPDTLSALADAREPDDFGRLLAEAVGDDVAREMLARPVSSIS